MPDFEHYEEFPVGRLLRLPMIKDIRSNFAIRTVKLDAALPLGHLAPPAPTRKAAKSARRR